MLTEYLAILLMIFVGIAFGIIPILIAKLIAPAAPNDQKSAPYECGFPPSQNARTPFNIKFYLMAILFILFDVETSFLFPWAVSLDTIGLTGYLNMLGFLAILIAGFIYEWQRGALEWS